MIYLLPKNSLQDYLQLSAQKTHLVASVAPVKSDEVAYKSALSGIQSSLKAEKGNWPTVAVFELLKRLEVAVHLEEATELDWLLMCEIREALQNQKYCLPISNHQAWKKALQNAVVAVNASQYRNRLNHGNRSALVAQGLSYLKKEGFEYDLSLQGGYLSDKEYRRLCQRIEKKIANVGGEEAANRLLGRMKEFGRVLDGSYLHARVTTTWGGKHRSGTPWHYIYSLCLKHIDTPKKSKFIQRDLEKMEMLAMGLAASYDVETHSAYEHMSIDLHSAQYVLQETHVYDELFAFPQWQPQAALFLVKNWIKALDAAKVQLPFLSPEKWIELGEKIYALSHENAVTKITSWQLASDKISFDEADEIANLLALGMKERNGKYLTPRDTKGRNTPFYPLLESKNGIFLQPRPIAVRAFCERLYTLIRQVEDKSLGKKTGEAFEHLSCTVLKNFGCNVTIEGKRYRVSKNVEPEIDLVIETPDRIFLIECKEKALTGNSRSGFIISELGDLNRSFLKMFDQLCKHELKLLKDGQIKFKDGNELHLNGRKVEKIALSLFDHGSIQDRQMIQNIVLAMLYGEVTAYNKEANKITKETNKLIQSLGVTLCEIQQLSKDDNLDLFREAMMSTWWLSIDQLYYMCQRKNDLWEGMKKVRHIAGPSRDFIYELNRVDNLSSNLDAVFEKSVETNSSVVF